jgi:hypothetical protein
MWSQRTLLGLVIGLTAAGGAGAQSNGSLRWPVGATPLGLQATGGAPQLPCSTYTFSCAGAATLPLYASASAPRTLSMQMGPTEGVSSLGIVRPQGLHVSVVGRAGLPWDLGLYGRVGTTFNRASSPLLAGVGGSEAGLSYGVGLSWDFSRGASAAFGFDSYDLRSAGGEVRDVRTSLGLQWRY